MAILTVSESEPGFEIYEIDHPRFTAKVSRHGAQIIGWNPAGAQPVLYRSPKAFFKEGKPLRAGVPICWPWFAAHPTDPTMPAHGFVRTRFWHHDGFEEEKDGVCLRFSIEDDASTFALWPYHFRLEVEIRIGERLGVRLTSINKDTRAFAMGGALHTYLAVGDLEQTVITGLEGSPYFDKLGTGEQPPAREPLRIYGEMDRIYHHTGPARVRDAALKRELSVENHGNRASVIWNPGAGKVIADVPDDGHRHFVAVEAAVPPGSEVVLAPGEKHVLETWISVSEG